MPLKNDDTETECREVARWDKGVGWIAYPDETMQRASHAFETDEGIFIVDPVDAEGTEDLIESLDGDVAGIVILLDRHKRDSEKFARRYDVPVRAPEWVKIHSDLDVPVKYFEDELGETGYELIEVVNRSFWNEGALYSDETRTLICPEALGNNGYFTTSKEKLGVHPMLRLKPPKSLAHLNPERVLVGHGPGITENGAEAVRDAVKGSRKGTLRLYAGNVKGMLKG